MAKVTIFCDRCGKEEYLAVEPCNGNWGSVPIELDKTRSVNVPGGPEKVMLCEECREHAEKLVKSTEHNLSVSFDAFINDASNLG